MLTLRKMKNSVANSRRRNPRMNAKEWGRRNEYPRRVAKSSPAANNSLLYFSLISGARSEIENTTKCPAHKHISADANDATQMQFWMICA